MALAAARASVPHHITSTQPIISSVQWDTNVGLNSAPIAPLAHASTVVQAFRRLSDAVRGAFAGHLFWQSVQTDSHREEFESLRRRRFGRRNKDYQDQCLVLVLDPLLSTH